MGAVLKYLSGVVGGGGGGAVVSIQRMGTFLAYVICRVCRSILKLGYGISHLTPPTHPFPFLPYKWREVLMDSLL